MSEGQAELPCKFPQAEGVGPDVEVSTCCERSCANCDARARLKGAAYAEARIVAWLREGDWGDFNGTNANHYIALAIEDGVHHEQ